MTKMAWDYQLTSEQSKAASQFGQHARLLAGPGTGKSHTLARRIVYLVTEQHVNPSDILVLTFTRMATRDLRVKIASELREFSDALPYISTLHGFALRQLRLNSAVIDSVPQPLRIADDWEERELIQEELKLILNKSIKEVQDSFAKLSSDWETLDAEKDGWIERNPDPKFLGAWQRHRQIYGYVLRSELVYQLKRALQQVVRFQLEPHFKHLLIDEYQDLNPCDLAIVEASSKLGMYVLASGDDDQSIYGFRHADPSGIRNFLQSFPGSLDLVLTECRRCDREILEISKWVAEQDNNRVAKSLHESIGHEGGEVHLLSFSTGLTEAQGVARLSKRLIENGTSPSDILVLLRSDHNGAFSRPLVTAFENCGVAVSVKLSRKTILDDKPGRQLLAFLRLVSNESDHLAWRTRLHFADGIGPSTIGPIYNFADENGVSFFDAIQRLDEYSSDIRAFQLSKLKLLIASTIAETKRLRERLRELLDDPLTDSTAALLEVLRVSSDVELSEDDGRFEVRQFLEHAISSGNARNLEDLFANLAVDFKENDIELDQGKVNVLTMHQAKGLEADSVFIIAAEDETFPQETSARNVAEDRRLLYVSMTRAKHRLFISYCGRRLGQQAQSGRNQGIPDRHLTRLLRDSPMVATLGEPFVETWIP